MNNNPSEHKATFQAALIGAPLLFICLVLSLMLVVVNERQARVGRAVRIEIDSLARAAAECDSLYAAEEAKVAQANYRAFRKWLAFLNTAEGWRLGNSYRGVEQATYNWLGFKGSVFEMTDLEYLFIAYWFWLSSRAAEIDSPRVAVQVADAQWGLGYYAIKDLQRRLCVSLTCQCEVTGRFTDYQIVCLNSALDAETAVVEARRASVNEILGGFHVYRKGWLNRITNLTNIDL